MCRPSLGKDQTYTALVWGRESALRLHTLPEDAADSEIAAGTTRLRVFNATIDAGSVDVYLTAAGADLAESAPLHAAVAGGTLGAYRDVASGSQRLRLTGAGDPADLRLDVPLLELPDRKHVTLVLTAGASGVLLDALLLPLQAAATRLQNTQARLRVVASVAGAASVALTLGGQPLAGGYRSPTVGPYARVAAGSSEALLRIDGAAALALPLALAAGTDHTLLVHGSPADPKLALIADDNRLPLASGRAKLRLVHGASGTDPLTLSVDYLPLAANVAAGATSAYTTLATGSAARIDVNAASAALPVYTLDNVNLQSGAVYSLFILGGNAAPTGVLRKER